MDKVLELFDTYRCHLKRRNISMSDFLKQNYSNYIDDLKASVEVIDNPTLGDVTCLMIKDHIDEIETNCESLIDILRLYENGNQTAAAYKASELFTRMKPQMMFRYSGAIRKENYYRIRTYESNPFPLDRKEMFHIPLGKNHLVRSERYSLPGHPCLYLASQATLAWYECKKPDKFALAQFSIPQDEKHYLTLVDFAEKLMPMKHNFYCWFCNELDDVALIRKYLLKYIYIYPLRAACSVTVEHPGSAFIEEYVIPQLLLQWILNDDDFDGVRYESCSNSDEVHTLGRHNLVLVTKDFDADGFDKKLRKEVKLTLPKLYETNKSVSPATFVSLLDGKKESESRYLSRFDVKQCDFQNI